MEQDTCRVCGEEIYRLNNHQWMHKRRSLDSEHKATTSIQPIKFIPYSKKRRPTANRQTVTFRIPHKIHEAMKKLENQNDFVITALRRALVERELL